MPITGPRESASKTWPSRSHLTIEHGRWQCHRTPARDSGMTELPPWVDLRAIGGGGPYRSYLAPHQ